MKQSPSERPAIHSDPDLQTRRCRPEECTRPGSESYRSQSANPAACPSGCLASVSPPIASIHFIAERPIFGGSQKWGVSARPSICGYCTKWISTTAAPFTEYGAQLLYTLSFGSVRASWVWTGLNIHVRSVSGSRLHLPND